LKVLYPVFGDDPKKDWVLEDANWWIIESLQGVTFAIFGGANPDPDSFNEFRKVR